MFQTEAEAKRFLVQKIIAQAEVEGEPLSPPQRWMLSFSESDPEFAIDPSLVAECEAEIPPGEYEVKIAGLLSRAYARDRAASSVTGDLYQDARRKLAEGDHYLSLMINQALGPRAGRTGARAASSAVGQVAQFLLLAVPGAMGLVIAAILAWGAVETWTSSMQQAITMLGVAMFLAYGGLYLIKLWRRERRG